MPRLAQLQHLTGAAVTTLEKLLTNSKPTVQLGAARTILEMSLQAVELEDVVRRFEQLEQRHVYRILHSPALMLTNTARLRPPAMN